MRAPRLGFLLALTIATLIATLGAMSRSEPYTLYSAMDWQGCHGGSCAPAFYPLPDGRARLLACSANGWCALHVYEYWTDENCNRLTNCSRFSPARRSERGRP